MKNDISLKTLVWKKGHENNAGFIEIITPTNENVFVVLKQLNISYMEKLIVRTG